MFLVLGKIRFCAFDVNYDLAVFCGKNRFYGLDEKTQFYDFDGKTRFQF